MIWGGYIESVLPSRHAAALTLHFQPDHYPNIVEIRELAHDLGYRLAEGSISITRHEAHEEWHLVLIAAGKQPVSIPALARGLQNYHFLRTYHVVFARS
jgi:putative Mg2+ transporter-C (MgtC) family protein